jgi:pimeloyl-ACP methyl ester carboxylesterase
MTWSAGGIRSHHHGHAGRRVFAMEWPVRKIRMVRFICLVTLKGLYDKFIPSPLSSPHSPPPSPTHPGMVGHVTQLRRLLVNLALVAKDDTDDQIPASTSHSDRDDTDLSEIDDQLLSPLPLPAIHLMGHSMGGAIAVGYAERYPDDVASLTLLTPAGLMDKGVFSLLRSLPWFVQSIVQRCLRRNSLNAIRNDFLRHGTELENRVVAQAQAMHKRNPHAFPAIFRSILAFPLAGLEETITNVSAARLPTLLVWAEYDRVVPFEPHYGRWKALLKTGQNVQYEVVKEAGHGFLKEKPAVVGDMVVRFLKCPPSWVPPALIYQLKSHPSTITI